MPSFLKNHPFPVEAYFDRSLVLTFALPRKQLENLVPKPLTLDTFEDKWAFVAIAMVQTRGLRPKGFPKFMGNDFFLAGYRIFVRYHNQARKKLRGLYILKSETDKRKMKWLGNVFTHYNYTTTDISIMKENSSEIIRSEQSKFNIRISRDKEEISLPSTSPFRSWKEARRYAGPLPFTFTCMDENKILIIEGVRSNWEPQPVWIQDYGFEFFEELGLKDPVFASAFEVRNIPYYWKKGLIERWN